MSVNETKADAIRVFLQQEGIVIDFAADVTAEGADSDQLESVVKMLLPPSAFRRMGMALQEAVRKLPPGPGDAPAVPSPPPVAPTTRRQPPKSVAAGSRKPQPAVSAVKRPPPDSVAVGGSTSGYSVSLGDATAPSESASKKPALEYILEPTIDMSSSKATPSPAGELSARLLEVVQGLAAPYVHERSFRIRQGELLPNRYLLSVGRPDDGSASDEAMLNAFAALGLPEPFLKATEENISKARCVHFGFEGDAGKPLLKVYLEVAGKVEGVGGDEGAVLEHLAYKWDPTDDATQAMGRYFWYPNMTADEIRSRVDAVYGGDSSESRDITHGVIELAAARMPATDIHYLEIEEDGNDRRSYSINFYDADMKVRDLQPLLNRMRGLFEVEPGRFQILYDQIKGRRFGHLAGGTHRNGNDFFNIYYGPQSFDQGTPGEWRGSLLRGGSGSSATTQ
jgi:hypothetical protein